MAISLIVLSEVDHTQKKGTMQIMRKVINTPY